MNYGVLLQRPSATLTRRVDSSRASTALDSRPGPRPGRGSGGVKVLWASALALSVCLMFGPATALGVISKAKTLTDVLTEQYALSESIDGTDGAQIRRKLLKLLSRADVKLFLATIKEAEGGAPNLMVGGCRASTLKLHPALTLPRSCRFYVPGWGFSTASGNYQITYSNWKEIAPFLGLEDFSETNQALAALELIRRGGGAAEASTKTGLAMKHRIQNGFLKLLRGNLKSALCLASYDWASSTCSPLPASYKTNYAKLAEGVRKRLAAERLKTAGVRVAASGPSADPKVASRRSRPETPCDARRHIRRQGTSKVKSGQFPLQTSGGTR